MTSLPAAADPTAQAVPPGRPGDFDFLTGEWRIANRMLDKGTWIEFPGEATVVSILGGIASIEELRIPARNFSGMGLRLLDMERKVWSDFWVNAKSGALSTPGQEGGFADGVGTFVSTSEEDGRTLLWRGVWDRITPTSCRWRQGGSRDGGQTWEDSWFMDWTRVR
ncbi:MAG: hypothetical protein INF91_03280 [Alphaproteobacteria bacterium]|nr:hypothetical protein [Alphaproteobacteria bacterium]